MGTHIKDLADESIVSILEYLRAADLVSTSEVSKRIFLKSFIRKAVIFQLDYVYPTSWRPPMKPVQDSHSNTGDNDASLTNGCDALFVCEVKTILFALASPPPTNGKGYWISTTWVANARKHYLSLNLPVLGSVRKKFGPKKAPKIRYRNASDVPAPGSEMNCDITCSHNDLTGSNCTRLKKRIIDRQSWLFLRKHFPDGPEYKFSEVRECRLCLEDEEALKATASLKQIEKLRPRQSEYLTGPLASLAARKNGVPSHLLTQKMLPVFESEWEQQALASYNGTTGATATHTHTALPALLNHSLPLLPGLYNLLSKSWLKSWRSYVKDSNIPMLVPTDCTNMLCHSHGMLVIPPHVEEFLVGTKKSLLSGLGSYEGEIFEILCADEWDALQASLKSLSDFSVRFCVDGDSVTWNIGVCNFCCPFGNGSRR